MLLYTKTCIGSGFGYRVIGLNFKTKKIKNERRVTDHRHQPITISPTSELHLMAAISFTNLTPFIRTSPPPHLHLQPKITPMSIQMMRRRKRGELLVTNAGPPSSTSLILAFILPLSLLAGTVFASIRIADDLDDKFLQDVMLFFFSLCFSFHSPPV